MKSLFLFVILGVSPASSQALADFYQPVSADTSRKISYRSKDGDNLFSIAQRFLGDPYQAKLLQQVNRIEDPLRLQPGQSIQVPVPMLGILYWLQKAENCDLVEVNEQHRFAAGDRFQLRLATNIEGYLYVLNRRPGGDMVRLHGGTKVTPFAEYVLPQGGDWFQFDAERGADELIVLVSPTKLSELDSDLTGEAARERIRRVIADHSGKRGALGEGRDGFGRSLVVSSPVGDNFVLAHRIVLRKR